MLEIFEKTVGDDGLTRRLRYTVSGGKSCRYNTIDNYRTKHMSNSQKPNKHLRTKSNHKTTTAGSRANKRLNHGVGKNANKYRNKGKKN